MRNFITLAVILLSYLSNAQAPGSLDLSFGNNGVVTTDLSIYSSVNAITLQPDGKIIVVGNISSSIFCGRYDVNGILDQSFGNSGTAIFDLGPTNNGENAKRVVVQSDGKIIIGVDLTNGCALMRLNYDGSLDNLFGVSGVATILDSKINALKIEPLTGKIITGGNNNSNYSRISRYNSDGTPDTSFNNTGFFQTGYIQNQYAGTVWETNIVDLAIDQNGKIYGVGFGIFYGPIELPTKEFAIKLNNDGSIDNNFSTNGVLFYENPDGTLGKGVLNSLSLNQDGTFFVGGTFKSFSSPMLYCKIFKINLDGSPNFNSPFANYYQSPNISGVSGLLRKDNNGNYLSLRGINSVNFEIRSFNPDFTSNSSFGLDGKAIYESNVYYTTTKDMIIQNDNKVIVVCSQNGKIVLVRYNGTGSLANETFTQDEFSFYPNPSQQSVFFKTNNQELVNQKFQIYDANGRIVSNGVIDSIEMEINISQLEKGIYFLKVDHYSSSYKLIKN